jgi:uncharacterized membrane protein
MAKVAIVLGSLLVLLGLSVFAGVRLAQGDWPSATALIPAFLGVPIVLLGLVALNAGYRKHAMHGVAVLALLGVVAPLGRLAMQLARGADVGPVPLISLLLTGLLSALLLGFCIKSFVDARRARNEPSV